MMPERKASLELSGNPKVANNAANHLSEFELDEALIGDAPESVSAHVAACTECSLRLDAIREPLYSFNQVTLAWAETRSAAMPLPLAGAEAALLPNTAGAHLTEDELDGVLIEGATPQVAAHLASCESCQQRFDQVAQPLASFRAVSLAWSERRSATLPVAVTPQPSAAWGRRLGWIGATAAAALLVVLAPARFGDAHPAAGPSVSAGPVAVVAGTPQAPAQQQTASVAAPSLPSHRHSQRQLDADNQMLAAIDRELELSQQTLASFGVSPRNEDGLSTAGRGRNGSRPAAAGRVVQE